MSDGPALLKTIVAQPDEDTPRLVFADWLDEHAPGGWEGRADRERAAYVRDSVAVGRIAPADMRCKRTGETLWSGPSGDDRQLTARARCRCDRCALARRLWANFRRGAGAWEGEALAPYHDLRMRLILDGLNANNPPAPRREWLADARRPAAGVQFRRGFPAVLSIDLAAFAQCGRELVAGAPYTAVRPRGAGPLLHEAPDGLFWALHRGHVPPAIWRFVSPAGEEHVEGATEAELVDRLSAACLAFARVELPNGRARGIR